MNESNEMEISLSISVASNRTNNFIFSPHVVGQMGGIQASFIQKLCDNRVMISVKNFIEMFFTNFVARRIGHERAHIQHWRRIQHSLEIE